MYRYVSRSALEVIYKSYVRPHLDYGDVVYHIPDKNSKTFDSVNDTIHPLMARIESVQYEAACVVYGAWKGTSRDKLYTVMPLVGNPFNIADISEDFASFIELSVSF